MNPSIRIFWRWTIGTALLLTALCSAAIWKEMRHDFSPSRSMDVVPADVAK
jgi:hypothetical protein